MHARHSPTAAALCSLLATLAATVPLASPAEATEPAAGGALLHGASASGIRAACGPALPGRSRCFALVDVGSRRTVQAQRDDARPLAKSPRGALVGPAGGLTPEALATAYGYSPDDGGSAQTVAIVDAYDDPEIEADLAEFSTFYGLPSCDAGDGCLKKVGQSGGAVPAADTSGWSVEESLDVETVHATCPKCKILLVEANSEANVNLARAANEAVALGATVVSNSYGAPETAFGASEREDYEHPGVPIVASTGDWGWDNWNFVDEEVVEGETRMSNDPASLPTVVAVGGTKLDLNSNGTRAEETVWNWTNPAEDTPKERAEGAFYEGATGGGCSLLYSAQPWQRDVAGFGASGCAGKRLDADVSAVGDPETGLDIYDTYDCGEECEFEDEGWVRVGGTSLSSPFIASLYALAGGGHGLKYPALTLYGHAADAASRFDITQGGNGFCNAEPASACGDPNGFGVGRLDCEGETQCDAAPGFDGPSGVGTPVGLGLFEPEPPVAVLSAPTSPTAGRPSAFGAGASEDSYPGGTIASAAWEWGDGTLGSGVTASHTYAAPGSYTVTLTVTDSYGLTSVAATKVVKVGESGGSGGTEESGAKGEAKSEERTNPTEGPKLTEGLESEERPPSSGTQSGGEETGGGGAGGGDASSGAASVGTASSPIAGGGSAAGGTAAFQVASPSARLTSGVAKASPSGFVKLPISCAASGAACVGTLTLRGSVGGGHAASRASTVFASASFSAAPGKTITAILHLSAKARAVLARTQSLRATVTILLRAASGVAHTTSSALTIHFAASVRSR
jgi:PKD domain